MVTDERYEDDFLRALPSMTDDYDDNGILHIDFAHLIAIGYQNEKYYLVIVVGGRDFLWASPTTTTSQPELLLQDFVDLTGIKIRQIRLDGASVFLKSSSFQAWVKTHGAVLCPATGYNHTMNARSENAVRICKDHV